MTFEKDFFAIQKVLCSIPEDQKPIHEYIETKENAFFNSFNFFFLKNDKTLFALFNCFIFFYVLFKNLNTFEQVTIFFTSTILWIGSICLLFVLFINFRYFDIIQRFQISRLFYEESSWFDGQIWEKPFFLIKNDKLISLSKLNPLLKKSFRISFFMSCFYLIFFILGIF